MSDYPRQPVNLPDNSSDGLKIIKSIVDADSNLIKFYDVRILASFIHMCLEIECQFLTNAPSSLLSIFLRFCSPFFTEYNGHLNIFAVSLFSPSQSRRFSFLKAMVRLMIPFSYNFRIFLIFNQNFIV